MLSWVFIFLIIAIVSGILGFTALAGAAIGFAKIIFYVFLILFVVSLVKHIIGWLGKKKVTPDKIKDIK